MGIGVFPRGADFSGREPRFPAAAWCDPQTLTDHPKWTFDPGSVFVGAVNGHPLGIKDDRHMMTVAGSRAGKGRSVIVPNLCLYQGSVVAIDPKGDLATVTATRRGRGSEHCDGLGQDVYVLDPFGASRGNAGDYLAGFNPLDRIDVHSEEARDDAALIADALVVPSKSETHWTDAARQWLIGLILHVCETRTGEARSLATVRDLLTVNEAELTDLLAEMSLSEIAFGVVARSSNALVAMSDKERSGVLSTANVQTEFLDSPAMRRVLSKSDFRLEDLKLKKLTVYLSLPAGRMGTHARWLRLMIALTIEAMEREQTRPSDPVLVIMDEFHALGPMKTIERAAGLIAGFGVRLWPILQDLTQLQSDYKESWETFLGNAGLTQWFGVNDLTTLEYLSKRLGRMTMLSVSQSEVGRLDWNNGKRGQTLSPQDTPLMTAEEVGRYFSRQSDRQLILWPGADPIAIDRVAYDQDRLFERKFNQDLNYA
ncbi:MAG: type IV secretory system conjugative DNA transfer family protein [Pseudomonadota bacterium]